MLSGFKYILAGLLLPFGLVSLVFGQQAVVALVPLAVLALVMVLAAPVMPRRFA